MASVRALLSAGNPAPVPALVRAPFHDAELHAVRVGEDVWVAIRRTCEDLGVSVQGQLEKLGGRPWATVKLVLMVAADGKEREVACVHLKALPMWLATIEPSRVAEHIRPRLLLFQTEAADVLQRHFLGITPKPPAKTTMDPYLAAALELRAPVPEQVQRAVQLLPRPKRLPLRTWVERIDEAVELSRPAPPALPARCSCHGLQVPIPAPRQSIEPTRELREAVAADLERHLGGPLGERVRQKIALLRATGPLDIEAYSALSDVRVYDDEWTRAVLPLLCVCDPVRRDARLRWSMLSARQPLAGELETAALVLDAVQEPGAARKMRGRVAKAARGATWETMAADGDGAAQMMVEARG